MKKILRTTIFALLLAGVGYGVYHFFFKEKPAIIVLQKEKVEKGDVTTEVTATGSVQPVDEIEVGTQVSGLVSKIYVDYNSQVRKGELIAELDKTNLQENVINAQANYNAALNEVSYYQQNYDRKKKMYDNQIISKADYEQAYYQLHNAKAAVTQRLTMLNQAKTNLGYANIYADIEYPQNTITPQNKRKDRLSNRVYVGNLDPAISICNKDHQSLGYFYTDTDYLLEAKFDKHELEDITEIMWEVSTVYPQSPTSYKYIFLGQSNPFSVTSIPNEVCQVIQAKVQYKTNDCGQTEWFSREFTFHNKNPYTMNFTNPAFEYTIVSVYEGSEDNGRDISVNKTLYNGEYELELWSDFCKIQSIKANTPSTRIPLSGLTDGIYYIRLIINKQTVSTSPIIVKH